MVARICATRPATVSPARPAASFKLSPKASIRAFSEFSRAAMVSLRTWARAPASSKVEICFSSTASKVRMRWKATSRPVFKPSSSRRTTRARRAALLAAISSAENSRSLVKSSTRVASLIAALRAKAAEIARNRKGGSNTQAAARALCAGSMANSPLGPK